MKLTLALIFLFLLAFDTFTAFACDAVPDTDMSSILTGDANPKQAASRRADEIAQNLRRDVQPSTSAQ